jgi:hypothetical protein
MVRYAPGTGKIKGNRPEAAIERVPRDDVARDARVRK